MKRDSIRFKIAKRVCLGLVLTIAALSAVNLIYMSRRVMDEQADEVQLDAQLAAAEIANWQCRLANISETLAETIEAQGELDEEYIYNNIDAVADAQEDLYFVYVATEEGNMYMARGVIYNPTVDVRERDWYKEVKSNGVTTVIDPYVSATRVDIILATVATPIYINGEFAGAVGVDADISSINDYVNSLSVKDEAYAFLVDRDGNIVTHPYSKFEPSAINTVSAIENIPGIESIIKKPGSGMGEGIDYSGERMIYASSYVGESDWIVVVAYSQETYYKNIYRGIWICIVMAVICLLLSGGDIVFAIRRILKPLEKINPAMERIVSGDYTTVIEFSHEKDEIGELQNKLAEMTRQLSDVVNEQRYVLSEIASGNLAVEDMDEFPGELNEIAKSVNDIKAKMNDIISDIQFSALNLESYSMGINDTSDLDEMREIFTELSAEADTLMEKTGIFKTYLPKQNNDST